MKSFKQFLNELKPEYKIEVTPTDSIFEKHKTFKMSGIKLEDIVKDYTILQKKDIEDYNSINYWINEIKNGTIPLITTDFDGIIWDGFHRLVASKISDIPNMKVIKSEKEIHTDEL